MCPNHSKQKYPRHVIGWAFEITHGGNYSRNIVYGFNQIERKFYKKGNNLYKVKQGNLSLWTSNRDLISALIASLEAIELLISSNWSICWALVSAFPLKWPPCCRSFVKRDNSQSQSETQLLQGSKSNKLLGNSDCEALFSTETTRCAESIIN